MNPDLLNFDLLVAAGLFAIVSYITPGPNNTMILASSVNFGLRRSLPHLAGICLGFGFMLVLVGLGLHQLLASHPQILQAMRWAGAAYLLWLAWKLATLRTSAAMQAEGRAQPLSFLQAAAFQWINPKAWVMATTAMTAYLPDGASPAAVLLLAGVQTLLGSPCVLAWAAFGNAMRRYLQDPLHMRTFNITMAITLVASLYPLLQG